MWFKKKVSPDGLVFGKKLSDCSNYKGQLKDGNPHGQETLKDADGRKEKGEWKFGEFIGK